MKKNSRISRYYDLTQIQGVYTGSSDLIGWWDFSEKDIGKTLFYGTTSREHSTRGYLISGSFVNSQGVVRPDYSAFESPGFLEGQHFLRNSSVTISNKNATYGIEGFDVSVPRTREVRLQGITVSLTFRLLQQYEMPMGADKGDDGVVELFTICDTQQPNGRLAAFYDNDGAGNQPTISLVSIADDGSQAYRWNSNPGITGNYLVHPNGFKDYDRLRDWQRLDLVISDTNSINSANFPNGTGGGGYGAAVYINGEQLNFNATAGSGAGITTNIVTKVLFGKFGDAILGLNGTNRIKIGECIIWNTTLSANQISYLYGNTQESNNSGILSNPTRDGSLCGECEHDAYPTIQRSGDYRRLGNRTPLFDDNIANNIPQVSGLGPRTNYPTLLLSGADAAAAVGSIISTPNTLPSIYVRHSSEAAEQGIANIINSYPKCHENSDASDQYSAFNDASAPVSVSTRKAPLAEVNPGWSPHAGERIIIDIDITPTSTKVLRVVTGSEYGNTFGVHAHGFLPSEEYTGLAYFNFVNGNFESIGGRESDTGTRINWCLPGEISSSYTVKYPYTQVVSTLPPQMATSYQDPSNPGLPMFTQGVLMEDFEKVPRIFQPYPSIIAHRGTFNHVFADELNTFAFYAGRRFGLVDPHAVGKSLRVELDSRGLTGDGTGPIPKKWYYDGGGMTPAQAAAYGGFGGNSTVGWNTEFVMSNDVKGRGWQNVLYTAQTAADDIDNIGSDYIWSGPAPPKPWRKSLRPAYLRTFSTMGRPIAYTNWCSNTIFHASSSQGLQLSKYISSPMILESFDIKASLKATRLQQPMSGTVAVSNTGVINRAGTSREMVWWSNTNNHVDLLTFFLLKQSNPVRVGGHHAGAVKPEQASRNSRRELISFSNHVFASPFLGWDWTNRIHLTHDPVNVNGTGNCSPVGGARTCRVFKVEANDILENVPAVDSFTYYTKRDGGVQQAHGSDGVFFHSTDVMQPKDPSPINGITGRKSEINAGPAYQPQRRFVSASVNLDINVPVRTAGAYATRLNPVLPILQTVDWEDPGGGHSPYFYANDSLALPIGTMNDVTKKPLQALPIMGTFWPGGCLSSPRVKVPSNEDFYSSSIRQEGGVLITDNWTLPMASHQFMASSSVRNKFSYSQVATPVISRAFEPSTRLIRMHSGSIPNDEEQLGGKDIGEARTVTPSVGATFNRTFLVSGNTVINRLSFPQRNPNPGFMSVDFEGTDFEQKTGYILLPEDELIFGVQWSPADPVHRSMESISTAARYLKYRGYDKATALYTGSLSGPREPDAVTYNGVFNPELTKDCNDEIKVGSGELQPESLGAHLYRWVGYCETNDLTMHASASCEIEQKPMSLRLYGTLIKDQKQKRHSLPQQLTTNCVHEVVGNSPVVDQFQLGTFNDLKTNTTLAKLISGSMDVDSYYAMNSWSPFFIFQPVGGSPAQWGERVRRGRGARVFPDSNRFINKGETFGDIWKIKRTRRLSDLSEYYYDSLTPDVSEAWEVDGASFDFILSRPADYMLESAFVGVNVPMVQRFGGVISVGESINATSQRIGASSEFTSNRMWGRSFPFEPRYAGVSRSFLQNPLPPGFHFQKSEAPTMYSASIPQGSTSGEDCRFGYAKAITDLTKPYLTANHKAVVYSGNANTYGMALIPATEKVLKFREMGSVDIETFDSTLTSPPFHRSSGSDNVRQDFYQGDSSLTSPQNPRGPSLSYIHNNFHISGSVESEMDGYFGIGNSRSGVLDQYYYYVEAPQGTGLSTPENIKIYAHKILTHKPRGYKYGLIASTPKKTSTVWRTDRYGQFRDMLEQRPYTSVYLHDPGDVAASRVSAGLQARQNTREIGATTCVFRSPAYKQPTTELSRVQVAPAETNCSNLSHQMTSSLPYFDGVLKNRDSAPAATDEVIVS